MNALPRRVHHIFAEQNRYASVIAPHHHNSVNTRSILSKTPILDMIHCCTILPLPIHLMKPGEYTRKMNSKNWWWGNEWNLSFTHSRDCLQRLPLSYLLTDLTSHGARLLATRHGPQRTKQLAVLNLNKKNLPGHCPSTEQNLRRVVIPTPQVTEHGVFRDHSDQENTVLLCGCGELDSDCTGATVGCRNSWCLDSFSECCLLLM